MNNDEIAAEVRREVERQIEAQRMEHVEHADAIRDAAVYGTGWIKYVWDHKQGRAIPKRAHPETVALMPEVVSFNRKVMTGGRDG